jgi:hypothetical protein
VIINELLSHATGEQMIELRNTSDEPAAIGGWFLSDNAAALKKFRISDGTTLGLGAFVTFSQSQFNTGSNAFLLDRARGGELWLSAADLAGNLTGFRTRVKFGAASADVSFGRFEISGQTEFVAQSARTFGNTNAAPLVGPVVISEIMYNPQGAVAGATEFIELHNISGSSVDLFDPARPTNTWRLSDGIEFTFPQGVTLAPDARLLVVEFDPVADPVTLAAFRTHYSAPSATVLGPYSGRLDNAGESIDLLKPDLPDGAFVPYVLVDEVNYRDSAPWPSGVVDGGGFSLQRRNSAAFGNDPANWHASLPTAGAPNNPGASAPPVIVQSPTGTNALVNGALTLQAAATGTGPLLWQWRFNGVELPDATNSSFFIDYLRLDDSGSYDVFVRNSAGPAFSAVAQVIVVEPPTILTAPPSTYSTNAGSNVTFSVVLVGSPPLQFQWKRDGVDLPGANTATLSLSNLTLNDMAQYTLSISNPYGVATANVTLLVLVRPGVTNNPVPQTVVQGGTAIFSATGGPIHPLLPMTNRWLRQGAFWPSPGLPILVITNCHPTNTGGFRCQFLNAAGNVTSLAAQLTVLPDFDGDGMGDSWETNYFGLSTNNSGDGVLDFDGDGMSNRDEFVAGTNPTNAASVLKLTFTSTNTAVLRFIAESNHFYVVECRTNLTTAPWIAFTNLVGSTLVRTALVNAPYPPPEDERYYRIVTPAAPQ